MHIGKLFVWQPYRAIDLAVATMLSLPRCRYLAAIRLVGRPAINEQIISMFPIGLMAAR